MSLTLVKPYFRNKMTGLGYREWEDSFTPERMPETIINKAFHVLITSIDLGAINQSVQDARPQVELSVLFKGARSESQGLDEAIAATEAILKTLLKASNRTSSLKNVIAENVEITPLSEENQRSVIVKMVFQALTHMGIEEA